MILKGQQACTYINTAGRTSDQYLNAVYYDGERVFYQIAFYTKNPTWLQCAARAEEIYRDSYVIANNGGVPGYWNFTEGLLLDFQYAGDATSRNAVILLSQNAAFAGDSTPIGDTAAVEAQREVALTIMSYLDAETLGVTRPRLALLIDQALGHLDQLYVSKTYRCPSEQFCPPEAVGKFHIKPFMTGMELQALIKYADRTGDTRVLPKVKITLDYLWSNAWVSADSSFWYENWISDPTQVFPLQPGAPDLNLLIAPAFAWVYSKTHDATYRIRGDAVFSGGVTGAFLDNGKQFNQNYQWSFDYVKWRSGSTAATLSGKVIIR